jgi:type II secretory pathway pseudopilin PulG
MTHAPSRGGFSLVEIVMTTAVVVSLTLGMFSALSFTTQSRNYIREVDLAREAARGQMEEILATEFASLSALYGDAPSSFDVSGLTQEDGSLAGEIFLDDSVAPAGANLTRITVRVIWIGHDQQEHTVQFNTFVSQEAS